MKTKILRKAVTFRHWANTDKGEKIIVRTLTTLTFICFADLMLLIIGGVCSQY